MSTYTEALNPRKEFAKEIERIEKLPQTQRWRAIKTLLLKMRPDIAELDKHFCADIKHRREFEMLKDTGASKSGSTRHLYSMPQYMYSMLHLIDPEFTKLQEDPESSSKINLKVARAFPEYCLARKV